MSSETESVDSNSKMVLTTVGSKEFRLQVSILSMQLESTGIIGLLERSVSQSSLLNSVNSSMGVACVGPASAAVASLALVCSSRCPLVACVAGAVHARRTVSPKHDAYAHNSWSDTVSSQSPRRRKRSKGWVTGPAKDFRPVSEVEAGVNFRLARGVRRQVVGSLPGQHQALVPGR